MVVLPAYPGRALRGHLTLVHGIYVEDVKDDLASLKECHEHDHVEPFGRWLLPHVHAEPRRVASRS